MPALEELFDAVERGDLKRVVAVLRRLADVDAVNDHGRSALRLACENARADIARVLLENGADPNVCGADNLPPLCTVSSLAGTHQMI